MSSTFRDLRVWQEAMALTVQVYRTTAEFPKSETYGLAQQMRRAESLCPAT
jgi:four helix bundle protein